MAFLTRAQQVPHVVGEDAPLDQDVRARGRAFVVDRVRTPLAGERPVVDQRDERRGDLLAGAAAEHRRILRDQIRLEAVPTRLVEEDTTGASLQDDRQLPRRGRASPQHRERPPRGRARDLLGVDVVEELEPDREARRLHAGLHARVGLGHGLHEEPRAHLVVARQQAVGVGDEDAAPRVRVRHADLPDRITLGAGGVVGPR